MRQLMRMSIGLAAALLLAGCSSGFSVRMADDTNYGPTAIAVVITREPAEPYKVIATFSGQQRGRCPQDQPYCRLLEEARQRGADAVWITEVDFYRYPGDWVMINGRMTQLREFSVETTRGKFIRFERRPAVGAN